MNRSREFLRSFGAFTFVLVIFVAAAAYLRGVTWLSVKVLPFLFQALWPAEIVTFLIVGPLAMFRKKRGTAGMILAWSSYVPGATLWMWSFLIVLSAWGTWAVALGLLFSGIGVVPMALVAVLLKSNWVAAGQIVFLGVLTWGQRFAGLYLMAKRTQDLVREQWPSTKSAA